MPYGMNMARKFGQDYDKYGPPEHPNMPRPDYTRRQAGFEPTEEEKIEEEFQRLEGVYGPEGAPKAPEPPTPRSTRTIKASPNTSGDIPEPVFAKIREMWHRDKQLKKKGERGPERRAAKDRLHRGIYSAKDEKGTNYQYDRYGDLVAEGFTPSRGRPPWVSKVRYVLERSSPLDRVEHDQTAQRRQVDRRAGMLADQQQASQRNFDDMMKYRYESMEQDAKYREAGMRIKAEENVRERDNRLETAKLTADHRERMAEIHAAPRDKAMDPFERAQYEWYQRNPEAFDAMMARETRYGGNKPPMTADQARNAMTQNTERIGEIGESLAAIDAELQGEGFWNLAGNDPVTVYFNRKAFKVPAADLQHFRDRLLQQRTLIEGQIKTLERYTTTGEWYWPSQNQPDSPWGQQGDPYQVFGDNYNDIGREGVGSGRPKKNDYGMVDAAWDLTKNKFNPPFQSAVAGEEGPPQAPRPPVRTNEMQIGDGPEQRAAMPPQAEIEQMELIDQIFFEILGSDPNVTNRQADDMAKQVMKNLGETERGIKTNAVANPPGTARAAGE